MRPHILRLLSFPAVAVTLLVLAPTGTGSAAAAASPGWQPALPVAANAPASSAPYYVWYDGPAGASVVNGFTGKTVATVASPDRTQILGIAAARDDRTFVLYTGRRFYELRLGGSGKPKWLVAVAGPPPPAWTSLSVSPDAGLAAYPTSTGVTVVSLTTGATRSWADGSSGAASDPSWTAIAMSRSSGSRSPAGGRQPRASACWTPGRARAGLCWRPRA